MSMATKQHKIFSGSSYDRGLELLLDMWPSIKKEVPDAELQICYGWETFLSFYNDNPERLAWKARMDKKMEQDGIIHHGRLGKAELKKVRQECGIWAYPTHFTEINCITALSAQADGCVPVVINLAALEETVQSGVKVDGDIYEAETKEKYLKELIALMKDGQRWKLEVSKAMRFAQDFEWRVIAQEWTNEF
jgi:glycosyltransferase involved in cell wall biosynthesis